MNKIILITLLIFLCGCASKKGTASYGKQGDTRTKKVLSINNETYLLTETTNDSTYGYKQSNPVMVGGSKQDKGPENERRYLNALLGPNGEKVKYYRQGSCCSFNTPNGTINNTGLLDIYKVYWDESEEPFKIYINMYDKGDLKIPVGFTAKKKN